MNDDFINQFEQPKPPRPEFTAALYQRITQPMKITTRARFLRAVALSVATIAVIASVLFFLPSTHAFADAIIQQIEKGNGKVQTTNDPAVASQLAGFTVLAPAYLPEGYTAVTQPGEWTVSSQGDVVVSISYSNQADSGDLSISQSMVRQGESNTSTTGPEGQGVTVRGQPGTWISGTGKSLLTWNENGIAYIIGTNTLSQEEVLKVAESLGK
jgi:hypothetical protein